MGSAPAGFEGAPEGSSQFEGCGSRLTDGWAMSHAKTFGGTMIRPDEDHVWFEDRWMVASLCDE
jgi:hypothetical protein